MILFQLCLPVSSLFACIYDCIWVVWLALNMHLNQVTDVPPAASELAGAQAGSLATVPPALRLVRLARVGVCMSYDASNFLISCG